MRHLVQKVTSHIMLRQIDRYKHNGMTRRLQTYVTVYDPLLRAC